MNPQDHESRTPSPFIERAESAGVVDDVHILPSTPVAAATVTGSIPSVLPVRHRAADRRGTNAISAAFVVIVVEAGILTVLAAVFMALRAGGVL